MNRNKKIEQSREIEEKILKGELGKVNCMRTVFSYLLITLRDTPVKSMKEIQKSGVAVWVCKGRQKKDWIPFDENAYTHTIPKVVATRMHGKEWTFRCYGKGV
jgi:hypothetical protein